jgi:hypothetical protein
MTMSRKKTGPVAVPFNDGKSTPTDAARRKAVEKALKDLSAVGLGARDPRFGLNNTMVNVPSKGGFVRVDLTRTDPAEVLLAMFDAVWKAGIEAGAEREREGQAAAIMLAFPALKDTFEKIADERIERIERDRASRRSYGDE